MKQKLILVLFVVISMHGLTQNYIWKDFACGRAHVLGLLQDSTIRSWGYNGYGQSGTGNDFCYGIPAPCGSDNDWIKIDAGYMHSLAMKSDSTIWGWGMNYEGQAGQNELTSILVPSQIGIDSDWEQLESGLYSGHAIKSDGSLWSWGINLYGILGIGNSNVDSICKFPVKIGTDNDWDKIFVGDCIAYAIKNDGSLWAWGYNYSGQISGAPAGIIFAPIEVDNSGDWLKITSGAYHVCGLKADSTLWTWGSSEFGALGNGIVGASQQNTPINIMPEQKWLEIYAAYYHTFAICDDEKLYGWGKNDMGNLGQANTEHVFSPVLLHEQSGWQFLAGGEDFTILGLADSESFYASGRNEAYQLGNCFASDYETEFIVNSVRDTINILAHPVNTSYCYGEDFSLSVYADNAWNYQWQISINEGVNWQNVIDDGIHFYSTDSVLQIQDATENISGNLYRCILSTPCLPKDTSDIVHVSLINIDIGIVLEGNTLQLSDTVASVEWLNCDSQSLIPGEVSDSFEPVIAGNYAAVLTNEHCIDTTECIYVNPVNINQIDNCEIQILYNSSTYSFSISACESGYLNIYDVYGKNIYSKKIFQGRSIIKARFLLQGFYIAILNDGLSLTSVKIIVV